MLRVHRTILESQRPSGAARLRSSQEAQLCHIASFISGGPYDPHSQMKDDADLQMMRRA